MATTHNIDFIINQFKLYIFKECYNIINTIQENNDIEIKFSKNKDNKEEKKKKYKYIDVYIEFVNGNKVYVDENQFIYDSLKNPKILGFLNKEGEFQQI